MGLFDLSKVKKKMRVRGNLLDFSGATDDGLSRGLLCLRAVVGSLLGWLLAVGMAWQPYVVAYGRSLRLWVTARPHHDGAASRAARRRRHRHPRFAGAAVRRDRPGGQDGALTLHDPSV